MKNDIDQIVIISRKTYLNQLKKINKTNIFLSKHIMSS